jgi:hypothetical protein
MKSSGLWPTNVRSLTGCIYHPLHLRMMSLDLPTSGYLTVTSETSINIRAAWVPVADLLIPQQGHGP